MSFRVSTSLIAIIFASILMGIVALPDSIKTNWPDNSFVNLFKNPKITLGLDLQGGTQLDYRMDLRNALAKNEDDDPSNDVRINDIVEGVRATIERRVNGLGVSEPNIFLSNIADEQHIIVELAGIKDVEEAKAVVGKTIQLEFKEPKTEIDTNERGKIDADAKKTLDEVLVEGADFVTIGNNTKTTDGKIDFRENKTSFISMLPGHYTDLFADMQPGQIHNEVIEGSDGYVISGGGQLSEKKGLYIVQLVGSEVKDHTKEEVKTFQEVAEAVGQTLETKNNQISTDFDESIADIIWTTAANEHTEIFEINEEFQVYKVVKKNDQDQSVRASHILIAYQGSERADESVTRSKEEAKAEADKLLAELQTTPDKFADYAKEHSDGPSGPQGGDLNFFDKGQMTPPFENAAFAMEVDQISDVVETDFGYHIIKVTDKKDKDETINVEILKLPVSSENRQKLEEQLAKTKPYEVTVQEEEFTFNEIFYDLTPDPWKSTGLDGSKFKFATVAYSDIGRPQVNIQFDSEGAELFEELTGRLVGQPIAIFVGGQLISAPNVQGKIPGGSAVITGTYSLQEALQLANDLNTGAIDAPIILTGQYTISATLGENALDVSLKAGLIGLMLLALFMILYYRLMGLFAVIALFIYSIIIIFILKVTGIVMTLAGIAGIILSIGMAVDANILIFERTREELRSGKNFVSAIITGFERAWSSIRDSNVSSLITCVILWFFGNSIIRGFALMLAIGILISMFTAITVTRALLRTIVGTKLSKSSLLLGVKSSD